ncbi:iron chelate uptake ABC transporter family permease subunit [Brachybacterium hainanense]|uniref:Iron chelate uptake ABC transporter family permease subunit n=1 Tax=Brachybacterium hainanense TaxID=1541174 RepID=A0ABV6RB08_9MICO
MSILSRPDAREPLVEPALDAPVARARRTPPASGRRTGSGPFPTARARRRYLLVLGGLIVLSLAFGAGYLAIDNPMPVGSEGFWIIAKLRVSTVVVMLLVAFCQALGTVAFQTVTNNRIITPSIMGFESLYRAIQTSAVYLLGVAGLASLEGTWQFVLQIAAMMGLSTLLYGWLLSGKYANMQVMLLIGIIIGGGLGSVATFMQRLLTPSEFDILTARMFGSIANADLEQLPIAIPLIVVAGGLLLLRSRRLNVLSLGKEQATNLGLDHRREVILVLLLVSVLMAVSTAMIGPMTFFGFLVATLAYQAADTYDHRYVLPVAFLLGFVVLSGAYFLMKHVFYAQGLVSIIIELVGGIAFLVVILRKGRL